MPTRRVHVRFRWVAGIALAVVVSTLAWLLYRLPDGTWEAWVTSIPMMALILALAILPIVGFPVTPLYMAVGARFGVAIGLGIVAACTVIHLFGSFALARGAGRPLRWLCERCGWQLPQAPAQAAGPFALWVALLPGVSYALKNLTAPMAGVPFQRYFVASLPVHLAKAVLGLVLGGVSVHFSWGVVVFGIVYAGCLLWLTRLVARRVRNAAGAETHALSELPLKAAANP